MRMISAVIDGDYKYKCVGKLTPGVKIFFLPKSLGGVVIFYITFKGKGGGGVAIVKDDFLFS
ncbi:hypothetical protein [Erwinia typographi]|uniref:hypothetical protein n=1 Tax=Erwinia typographi TaxID=371042 RepID=UPI0012EE9C16|nr:hypothetical protein [Erwinia typographi]